MTTLDCNPSTQGVSTLKQCLGCGELKPEEAFAKNKSKRGGRETQCKSCSKLYRERTADARREYQKKYYTEHAEYFREKSRDYHAEHREAIIVKLRISYREKIEYHKEYHKQYYVKNRDRMLAYGAAYNEAHPEVRRKWFRAYRDTDAGKLQHRLSQGKRRAKMSSQEPIEQSDIDAIRAAQTDKKGRLICWSCGKPIVGEYHLDHWVPIDKDGAHIPGNLHFMHVKCNLKKSSKHPTEIGRLL
jgi:hypothetical protein